MFTDLSGNFIIFDWLVLILSLEQFKIVSVRPPQNVFSS